MAGEEGWEGAWRTETGDGWHAETTKGLEVEAARSAGWHVAVCGRKVTVAVGVGSRGCDVCGIHDIGIDKVKLSEISMIQRFDTVK
jgi:hypothetical protein